MPASISIAKLSPSYLTKDSKLTDFDCGEQDLNAFLLDGSALSYQEKRLAQTTLLYYQNRLVGYFTLSCDAIYLRDEEIKKDINKDGKDFKIFPGIKIARMAFNNDCKYQGCGTYVLDTVAGFVSSLNKGGVGCRYITVDAKPSAKGFYEKRGFKYNLHKHYKNKKNKSMRLDVWQYKPLSK